ncbi:MAG: ABC transporter ATP-binding protein [Candidatus Freyarchaeota archaeon]|nr:ABC transporter ATP-binding protein [Candidatus Jordarchaeia archaeon]MBS7269133.1 ABC transporter ATP-binding protein [Candidatus Jordarchaeia archaeon]MBS7279166.1 ABC transporter ATP-binding protein [Candidatus Jordarchaeia archaeon]
MPSRISVDPSGGYWLPELAIDVANLNYKYPDGTWALRNVSLKVYAGESVLLLGISGVGKSTLLMNLNGLLTPTKGTIHIFGKKVIDKNLKEIRRRVGFVFQNPENQLFCPTLWDDVAFGPINMGLPSQEVEKRVDWALKLVGLKAYAEKPPHHLSFGEKRRAAIATILSMEPDILLLDEPTANLDPKSVENIINILRDISSKGKTIIIATHDVNILPQITDRTIIMYKGKIKAVGPTTEILSDVATLEKYGLKLPLVGQLFHNLESNHKLPLYGGLPITIGSAEERILELLGRNKK